MLYYAIPYALNGHCKRTFNLFS